MGGGGIVTAVSVGNEKLMIQCVAQRTTQVRGGIDRKWRADRGETRSTEKQQGRGVTLLNAFVFLPW